MPSQRFTLGSMTCHANVSPQRPLLHHAVHGYSHTLHHTIEQGTLPKAILISQQVVPYQTHGGTCCPQGGGGLTPKNRSLADLSKNNPQTMKVATFPIVSRPCSNPSIYPLQVHSHRTRWKTTNHHKRPQDNSTSRKMEDLINDTSYIKSNDSTITKIVGLSKIVLTRTKSTI
jgi:hypothetical protein